MKYTWFKYRCDAGSRYADEEHPRPVNWSGPKLDSAVWEYLVEGAIKHPEAISDQILKRQAELRAQGDNVDSDIAQARRKIKEIDEMRSFYQRQAARGKITEPEFDARMDETEEQLLHWRTEMEHLIRLRDEMGTVQAGIDYATEFLEQLQQKLPDLNYSWAELRTMPAHRRDSILLARRDIVRALCQTVFVWPDGRVKIEGLLDGPGGADVEFDYTSLKRYPMPHSVWM